MAVVAHRSPAACSPARLARAPGGAQVPPRSLWRFLRRALGAQRHRDLDSAARRLLEQSGGRLTDSVEREIARRHLGI
jgi:hypothetical protein